MTDSGAKRPLARHLPRQGVQTTWWVLLYLICRLTQPFSLHLLANDRDIPFMQASLPELVPLKILFGNPEKTSPDVSTDTRNRTLQLSELSCLYKCEHAQVNIDCVCRYHQTARALLIWHPHKTKMY